jgi:hypothetical protein
MTRIAAILLVLLALPASASAAAPWTPPASLPLPTAPALAANANGLAIAVADTGGALPDIAPHSLASVFADGAFSPAARITPRNVAMGPGNGRVLPYGRTRLIGTGIRSRRSSSQAVVAFGRIAAGGATLDAPRGLGPSTMHAARASMAVNADGDAAIVYPVCRDAACTRVLVYLAVRRAGTSRFHSTRLTDGPGPLPQVTAAVNARGDAMAVWTEGSTLYARIRTAGGKLRRPQQVGAAVRGQHLAPSAVLSAHRAQLVGWLAQAVGEGEGGAGVAWVAQARDGGPFTGTRLAQLPAAGAGHYVSGAGVRVGYGSRGRALVAWTSFVGPASTGRFVVRTAELRGAANSRVQSLEGVTTVSDPAVDTVLSDLVVDPAGPAYALMLAGARGADSSSPTGVTVRASGGEEVTAPAGPAGQPSAVSGVLLPDGRVLAGWATVSDGGAFSVRAAPAGG